MKALGDIERIATGILESLPGNLCYHNYHHTAEVVQSVRVIGRRSGLDPEEIVQVQIAAWLHDLGYSVGYHGHENASKKIALRALAVLGMEEEATARIIGCIEATRFPQKPKNLMEAVICDADLGHLARPDLVPKSLLLRKEWQRVLGKVYTNRDWWELNLRFLAGHQYHTHYGKQVLARRKQKNINSLTLRYPDMAMNLAGTNTINNGESRQAA